MTGKSFLNGLAHGKSDILERFLSILEQLQATYCVIGGLAVNAYVEPVVSLDLDIVTAIGELDRVREHALASGFLVEPIEHGMNLSSPESDLRIQLQTDLRYQEFLLRAVDREILGYPMRVASLEDVLLGKTWAYMDETRRRSKRQKDLADIMRLVEAYPELKCLLPPEISNQMD
jgi:hypothetical protein